MTGQTSIFDAIEHSEQVGAIKSIRRKIRIGQIAALLLALFLVSFSWPTLQLIDTGAFIISLFYFVLALLSFKWPFPFLVAYTIVSAGFLLVFGGFVIFLWEVVVEEGKATATIVFCVINFIIELLVVRGTIAARQYNKLQ